MNITTKKIQSLETAQIHESIVQISDPKMYALRIEKALEMAQHAGYSHLIVYGDREHFANIHYFTGYDPRFEEAILILGKDRKPTILVGNEGLHYAGIIPYEIEVVLYQSLSLVGQARTKHTAEIITAAFEKAGIKSESTVGVIGSKYFTIDEGGNPDYMLDIPHYIVAFLKETLKGGILKNATDIMISSEYGLRTTLDIDEMAVLELAGTKTSRGVLNLLTHLKPGMSEIEASAYLNIDGNPLVAHPNVNFTIEAIRQGLASPAGHLLQLGSVCNVGFGYRSSMVARTGLYAHGISELQPEFADMWESVYVPYFKILVLWYESIGIGVTGKEVVDKILAEVPEFSSLGIGLNPGHLIHNDEWTNSVFVTDKEVHLRNGMAIQCDIIANPSDLPGVHVEDGLILADSELRESFKNKYPEAWKRIERRRNTMIGTLGINISDEVLPLSEIQGLLFPWMADLGTVMAVEK